MPTSLLLHILGLDQINPSTSHTKSQIPSLSTLVRLSFGKALVTFTIS